jgi:hypothetical protein
MRFALKLFAVLVVGTALGVAATWLSVYQFPPSRISNGPWKTNLLAGSAQSDPYRRAAVAIHGLFALSQSESAYYTASTGSDGEPLDGRLSQWLFRALGEANLPVICVETRHMRAVLKAQINKTDRNDARGIAQMSALCQSGHPTFCMRCDLFAAQA